MKSEAINLTFYKAMTYYIFMHAAPAMPKPGKGTK